MTPRPAPSVVDRAVELREAFEAWATGHGVIWWDTDTRLAEAIAAVLGIKIVWNDGPTPKLKP